MLKWCFQAFLGILSFLVVLLSTVFWCTPMYVLFAIKCVVPSKAIKAWCQNQMPKICEGWVTTNVGWIKTIHTIEWEVEGMPELSKEQWYFIVCNHQSWTDAMILQYLFSKKIPFLKFFVKDTLKFLPIIGLAWVAFEFPMMKRYSKRTLRKQPHLRAKSLEITAEHCRSFMQKPTTILNFIEGTRFTKKKHRKMDSPFKHLLIPKSGGFALTIKALEGQIDSLLHVTIVYPGGKKSFWDLLCGRVQRAKIHIEPVKIPESFFKGDYMNDVEFKQQVQQWLNTLWQRKDSKIEQMLDAA